MTEHKKTPIKDLPVRIPGQSIREHIDYLIDKDAMNKIIGMKACVGCVVLAIAISCANGNATEATDYSIASHWLATPAATNKAVDVFYLYPTAWTSTNPNPEVCAIDNPSMLQQAPVAFSKQATAFETIGNIYAPFYRQANLTSHSPSVVAGIPTTDALAAFDYYIRHFNHGRPFIMAGHSQGANALSNVLAQYMQTHPSVLARMIASYVIGYPVTAQYLADNPYLKFAEGSGDTGVIISYNTQAPTVPPGANPILWGLVGAVINPLTWTRTETPAAANQGFGSFMPDTNGVYVRVPQYADARIDISNGVLICSSADTNALGRINALAGFGIYHNFDYPFYYFNIRSNAANRTQNFLRKIGSDYDSDCKADPTVYDSASGVFTVFLSGSSYASSSAIMSFQPSARSLQPIPGDFDGDCKADPAVYDPIAKQLLVRFSSQAYSLNTLAIGNSSCVPVNGDFDGDCKADPALYSAASGLLIAWLSGSAYSAVYAPLGGAGWLNASEDYDGDGKTDPAVYLPAVPSAQPMQAGEAGDLSTGSEQGGMWQAYLSGNGYAHLSSWVTAGGVGVVPAPGDYDGDGKADFTAFQPATGLWLLALSGRDYAQTLNSTFGNPAFLPHPADYDNDGKTDPAVYDPVAHTFYAWFSGSNYRMAGLNSGLE